MGLRCVRHAHPDLPRLAVGLVARRRLTRARAMSSATVGTRPAMRTATAPQSAGRARSSNDSSVEAWAYCEAAIPPALRHARTTIVGSHAADLVNVRLVARPGSQAHRAVEFARRSTRDVPIGSRAVAGGGRVIVGSRHPVAGGPRRGGEGVVCSSPVPRVFHRRSIRRA